MTRDQLLFLFKEADDERYQQLKYQAGLQGIDLEGEAPVSKLRNVGNISSAPVGEKKFIFRDPSDYDGMSDEEKEKLTQEMMAHWRTFDLHNSSKIITHPSPAVGE